MLSTRLDSKQAMKTLNNMVQYTQGYIAESKAKEPYVANKLAQISINSFYDYLDGLARMHPGMLHHVYEWENVGNPAARLFELKKTMGASNVYVMADFLQSRAPATSTGDVFYDKATIMEEGLTVTIQEREASALFFEIDGEEFFRAGPIVVQNPGGEAVRGSFTAAFEEFYNVYFEKVYLQAIKFYETLRNQNEYEANFAAAVKGGNAFAAGRHTALAWLTRLPGDDHE
jgi:hypothetical protein